MPQGLVSLYNIIEAVLLDTASFDCASVSVILKC